ncbi:MAG: hypothetical protein ACK5MZ_09555 [Aestuariibaculum sp.]
MVVSLGEPYTEFYIEGVEDIKIQILVEENIIEMNELTLKSFRVNYPNQVVTFIVNNIDEYIRIMNNEIFESPELLQILDTEITDDKKLNLLQYTDESMSIIDKNYSQKIKMYILENNFDKNDLSILFNGYENLEEGLKEKVQELAFSNIEEIKNNISRELLDILMSSNLLDLEVKTDIFINLLSSLNEESIEKYLGMLKEEEYKKIFNKRTRPKFEISSRNIKLLEAFKEANIIYDYEEDSSREGYFRIIRKNVEEEK